MAIVYLGIGSNLGDRNANIAHAIRLLTENGVDILKRSSIIETDPVGGPDGQGKFLNGVLKAETRLAPIELLALLKRIEKELGRSKAVRNGPRPVDLDILLYGRINLHTPRLTIPHPRMLEREFVMRPFKEIEPELFKDLCHAHH